MDIPAAYDPDLYVLRKEAQQWLLAHVKTWKAGSLRAHGLSAERVLILTGELGSGKSWFLRSLAERERRVLAGALYLDLSQRANRGTPEDYARGIDERLRRQNDSAPGILLLDHVPPQLDDHLRLLEEAVLRPQLANHGSLAVMVLTHPSHICWRTSALRAGDRCNLAPFQPAQTQDQLRRLAKAGLCKQPIKPATAQRYGGGLPLLTYLLAVYERPQAYELLLKYVLSRIPADERESVRTYLDAVSALDVLEYSAIRKVLAVHQRLRPDLYRTPIHPIGLRNVLQKHWLAQPSADTPGHIVLLPTIRRAVRELLQVTDGALYAGLEEAARGSVGGPQ